MIMILILLVGNDIAIIAFILDGVVVVGDGCCCFLTLFMMTIILILLDGNDITIIAVILDVVVVVGGG